MDADRFTSPNLYPAVFDPEGERTGFVAIDEARYRAESFMDERVISGEGPAVWLDWPGLQEATAGLAGECDFIFHIGHVGSTLLSRLLGHSPRALALREPGVLRTLAREALAGGEGAERLDARAQAFLRLWARTYHPGQRALVKATSFTSELGAMLMQLSPSASAILMFVTPQIYLSGILSGAASREENQVNAALRLERLHRRIGQPVWRPDRMSEGEIAAMSWLSEVAALAQVGAAYPQRVLWIDFEVLLADPGKGLAACLRRLYGLADEAEVAALVGSGELGRYSKAPEFAYDAKLRRRVLAQADQEHQTEIGKGMGWLNAAGSNFPILADAMRRVAAARAAT